MLVIDSIIDDIEREILRCRGRRDLVFGSGFTCEFEELIRNYHNKFPSPRLSSKEFKRIVCVYYFLYNIEGQDFFEIFFSNSYSDIKNFLLREIIQTLYRDLK